MRALQTIDGSGRPELTASASDWLANSREELASRHDFILESLGEMDPVRKRLFVKAYRDEDAIQMLAILQANAASYVQHCIDHKTSHSFTGCRDEFEALDALLLTFPDDATLARKAGLA